MAEDPSSTIRVDADTAGAGNEIQGLGGIFGGLFGTIAGGVATGNLLAGAITGVVGAIGNAARGVIGFVGDSMRMNASLESTTLQFSTLMGSSERAAQQVQMLYAFAKNTPFETGPVIEASKQFQVFGGAALNTKQNLTLVGDAAAATGAPINEVAMWTGRLYAQLQAGKPFGEAAQRLGELAIMGPKTRAELEALQKTGASGDEIFKKYQDSLGKFTGAMDLQAHTWGGLTSSISDSIGILSATAFKPFFDMAKDGLEMILNLLGSDGMAAAAEGIGQAFGDAFAIIKAALGPVITGLVTTAKATAQATDSTTIFEGVVRAILAVVSLFVTALAGIVRAIAVVIQAYYEFRIAGNLLLMAFGKVVEAVLLGAKAIADGFAKISFGDTRKQFEADSAALSVRIDSVRKDITGMGKDTDDYKAKSEAVGTALRGFADKLSEGSKEIDKQAAAYKYVKPAQKEFKDFTDEAADATQKHAAKLTGIAKTADTFKKSLNLLGDELVLATKNHVPLNDIVEQYGKKVVDAVERARALGVAIPKAVQQAYDATIKFRWDELHVTFAKIAHAAVVKFTDDYQKEMQKQADASIAMQSAALAALVDYTNKNQDLSKSALDLRLVNLEREREAALKGMTGQGAIYDLARKQVNDYYDFQKRVALGTADTLEYRLKQSGVLTRDEQQKNVDAFKRDYDDMKASGLYTTQQIEDAWKKYHDAQIALNGDVSAKFFATLATMATAFQQLAQISGGSFGGVVKSIGETIGTMKVAADGAQGFNDGLKQLEKGGVANVTAGAAGMAAGLIGTYGAMQGATDHASMAKNYLGGMATGMSAGMKIAGPWGAAVGAAVGLIWAAVKGKPDWAKIQSDIQRDFGIAVSDTLAKQIEKTDKTVKDRSTAIMLNLRDVLKEAGGITVQNLDEWTKKTADLFAFVGRKQIDMKQAAEQFNAIFPQLAKTIVENNLLASQSFLNLIAQQQASGMQSAEVTNFLNLQTQSAINGLKTFTTNATVTSQNAASAMGTSVAAAFDLMRAGGMTTAQALAAVNPVIVDLKAQFEAAGFSGGEAFDSIASLAATAADAVVSKATTAVDGLNQMMRGLYNSGLMNQERFAGLSQQIGETFQSLITQGKDGDQVMQLMQPSLQTLYEMEKRFGFTTDESTQALLDKAKASGVVGDQYMSAQDRMAESTARVANAIEFMAGKMGYIPPAVDAIATRMDRAFGDVATRVEDSGDAFVDWRDTAVAAAEDVQEAVDGVTFGDSPGGLKEWAPMLAGARRGFSDVAQGGIQEIAKLKREVNALGSLTPEIDVNVLSRLEQVRSVSSAFGGGMPLPDSALADPGGPRIVNIDMGNSTIAGVEGMRSFVRTLTGAIVQSESRNIKMELQR